MKTEAKEEEQDLKSSSGPFDNASDHYETRSMRGVGTPLVKDILSVLENCEQSSKSAAAAGMSVAQEEDTIEGAAFADKGQEAAKINLQVDSGKDEKEAGEARERKSDDLVEMEDGSEGQVKGASANQDKEDVLVGNEENRNCVGSRVHAEAKQGEVEMTDVDDNLSAARGQTRVSLRLKKRPKRCHCGGYGCCLVDIKPFPSQLSLRPDLSDAALCKLLEDFLDDPLKYEGSPAKGDAKSFLPEQELLNYLLKLKEIDPERLMEYQRRLCLHQLSMEPLHERKGVVLRTVSILLNLQSVNTRLVKAQIITKIKMSKLWGETGCENRAASSAEADEGETSAGHITSGRDKGVKCSEVQTDAGAGCEVVRDPVSEDKGQGAADCAKSTEDTGQKCQSAETVSGNSPLTTSQRNPQRAEDEGGLVLGDFIDAADLHDLLEWQPYARSVCASDAEDVEGGQGRGQKSEKPMPSPSTPNQAADKVHVQGIGVPDTGGVVHSHEGGEDICRGLAPEMGKLDRTEKDGETSGGDKELPMVDNLQGMVKSNDCGNVADEIRQLKETAIERLTTGIGAAEVKFAEHETVVERSKMELEEARARYLEAERTALEAQAQHQTLLVSVEARKSALKGDIGNVENIAERCLHAWDRYSDLAEKLKQETVGKGSTRKWQLACLAAMQASKDYTDLWEELQGLCDGQTASP